jgi:hypothetical protein
MFLSAKYVHFAGTCSSLGFILLDETRIAHDIDGENCRQPPLDLNCFHGCPPRKSVLSRLLG